MKKLQEARFFLNEMIDQESRAFGDREPFDFYLSAFLNAARTVDYRLRHEQPTTYPAWRNNWDAATLTPSERRLIDFLVFERNVEVHRSGSSRGVKTDEIEIIGGSYTDKSGTIEVFGPAGMPPAHIINPGYFFTIDGVDRKATEACGEYLALLERMLAEFKAAHP